MLSSHGSWNHVLDPALAIVGARNPGGRLFILVFTLVANDVKESQLVDSFASRHDSQPVSQLLLLEELLRPIRILLAQVLHM